MTRIGAGRHSSPQETCLRGSTLPVVKGTNLSVVSSAPHAAHLLERVPMVERLLDGWANGTRLANVGGPLAGDAERQSLRQPPRTRRM